FDPSGKRGDSPSSPLYVQNVGDAGSAGGSGDMGGFLRSIVGAGIGGIGGGAPTFDPTGGALGGFAGALAGGGDVDPGKAYWVGESGPEPFIPHSAGSVVSRSNIGGTTVSHNYQIDARGAALGTEHRIGQAIVQAHRSAAAAAVQ